MKKQSRLVAVLSAAALLVIAVSMTSFAAGWQQDNDGTWHYYDNDDSMVCGQWKKNGSQYYYLDDDGNMVTDQWVDDNYYVGADGEMLVNSWAKIASDEESDEPGESWYFFGSKGKKISSDSKKIGGKTYYFDPEGRMRYGWYEDEDESVYYLGQENEGWRAESQWLWLDAPEDEEEIAGHGDYEEDPCEGSGWYYFGIDGKMYQNAERKRVNGKSYYFNEHGQMLYEWINTSKVKVGSNASLDGNGDSGSSSDMQYLEPQGWRADGWYELDGSKDTGTEGSNAWYYFKDGEPEKADMKNINNYIFTDGDGNAIWREKIKVKESGNKYFCFDQNGRMQTGLEKLNDGFYYFDENGYMKTGKVSNVEDDEGTWAFYFSPNTGKGWTGKKNGYLYWGGKRLEAEADYRLYQMGEQKFFLVNSSGKIQNSESKKYDVELNADGLYCTFNSDDSFAAAYTDKDLANEHIWNNNQIVADTGQISLYDLTFVPGFINPEPAS